MHLLLVLRMAHMAHGMYMEGELSSEENWIFLLRFCFLSLHGVLEYDIEYPEVSLANNSNVSTWITIQAYATQNLDLYYDTVTQWPRVYGDNSNLTSCKEKESVLQVMVNINIIKIFWIEFTFPERSYF